MSCQFVAKVVIATSSEGILVLLQVSSNWNELCADRNTARTQAYDGTDDEGRSQLCSDQSRPDEANVGGDQRVASHVPT